MRRKNEILIGLAIVVAVLTGILGIRYLEGVPLFGRGYSLIAIFPDADGLASGSSVVVSGVRVGRVDEVRLGPEVHDAVVEMTIDPEVRIPRGATASIVGLAALMDARLEITPGPPGNSPLSEGDTVQAEPVVDVLNVMEERLPVLTRQLDTLMASATDAFDVVELLAREVRIDLIRTLTTLEDAASGTATLTHDLQAFLETHGDTAAHALSNLNRILERGDHTLDAFQATGHRFDELLRTLDEGEGTLGRLLNEPDLHEQVEFTLESLNRIIRDFEENPGRYLRELTLFRLF